jgi:hypothetical protein
MKTNWILPMILALVFSSFASLETKACEIDFEILKGKKEIYQAGDEIVVKVKVKLTHRSCPEALKKTKFKMNGMKVVRSTGWKKISSMEYERKLKIVITGNKSNKVTLNAIRECEKDGGFGSLKLEAVPKE